jgi:hypothetical protein
MANDLPTGSVTGQQGWKWNRSEPQASNTTSDSTARAPVQRNDSETNRTLREENEILRRRRAEKDVALGRCEQRNQDIIDQYETVVAKKHRQFDHGNDPRSRVSGKTSLFSRFVRLICE